MSALEDNIKIALSDDFLDALMRVPRTQRKKVQKFIRSFRRNPRATGFNYETINNSSDPNMRSVRIDGSYRAILLKPQQGNVYVLLWVDNHDDAYDWAVRKRCVVHPDTGSLQIYSVDEEEYIEPSEVEDDEAPPPLFDEFRDRELRRIGVPEDLLGVVRKFRTRQELERAKGILPADVYEALYWLQEGDSLEEVYRVVVAAGDPKDAVIDTEDFARALSHPQSQRKFVVVDDENLEKVLDEEIEKWRVFLHPMQRQIVELELNGPIRVLGGAGTGKTVVAMHRAAYLLREVFNEDRDRILFTTFTKNLAADIRENLKKICDPLLMKRLEVVHLDQWVSDFLRRQGYEGKIRYYSDYEGELHDLWEQALAFKPTDMKVPESFYREEWEYVVQAQGCSSLRDYLRARRTGRGVPLRREERREIWRVFQEYRNLLSERGLKERSDAIRDARQLLEAEPSLVNYRSVLLDEAQDMGEEAFKLIRSMVPEGDCDLFIVGDGHQRIYRHPVVMKYCGINIQGRKHAHRLRINYRTTEEIRRFAVAVLEDLDVDDLDGGKDTTDRYKSLMTGEPPEVISTTTFEDELAAIETYIKSVLAELEEGPKRERELSEICLVARRHSWLTRYREALEARGIETYEISRDSFDDRSAKGLRVATMHRVKGLEFKRVIIAGVNEGEVPLKSMLERTEDEAVKEDLEARERALLYVAVTRAKKVALLTSHGTPSPFLPTNLRDQSPR